MNKRGAVVSYNDPDIAEAVRLKQLRDGEQTQLDRIESMLSTVMSHLGIKNEPIRKD